MEDKTKTLRQLDDHIEFVYKEMRDSDSDLYEMVQEFTRDFNHRFSIIEDNIDRLHEKIDKNLSNAQYKNFELTSAYLSLVKQVGLIGKELEEVDKLLS